MCMRLNRTLHVNNLRATKQVRYTYGTHGAWKRTLVDDETSFAKMRHFGSWFIAKAISRRHHHCVGSCSSSSKLQVLVELALREQFAGVPTGWGVSDVMKESDTQRRSSCYCIALHNRVYG
jgi:hypothetical protein